MQTFYEIKHPTEKDWVTYRYTPAYSVNKTLVHIIITWWSESSKCWMNESIDTIYESAVDHWNRKIAKGYMRTK